MFKPSVFLAAAALTVACGDNLGVGRDDAGRTPDAGGIPDGGGPDPYPDDAAALDAGLTTIDRGQAGGSVAAVELVGDLAFVGVGPRLAIWRLSDGAALVGETAPFPGVVAGVLVDGDRAFVTERVDLAGRVHVVDVSDPARPVETASFTLIDRGFSVPRGMAIRGDTLYIADQELGIAEVDVSDPDAPSVTRIVPRPGIVELEIVGDRLYYVIHSFVGAGVGALDLSDDLADLGELSLFGANGIAVTPEDLVVAAGIDGIQVHDVSDLGAPVERFRYAVDEGGPFARAVAVSADTAWIPAEDGLHVLDLTRPTSIERIGPLPMPPGANATAVLGDAVVVVTDRGQLVLFDAVARPGPPVVADVSLCSDCVGVAATGDLLLVADFFGGVRTADLATMSLLGHSTEPDELTVFEDVTAVGDTAYVADWIFGLRIYDVSNPSAPAMIGAVDTAGYPSSVAATGTRVYLGESTNGGALRVIDAARPGRASEIGATATSQARGLKVRGDLAFVADGSLDLPGGLRIFDVSDPAAIAVVGYYGDDCGEALDVALAGDLAVVACSFDGFHIVDVSDPARPTRVGLVPLSGSSAWSVAAWPGGAALGHDFGAIVVDLTDPAAPVTVEAYPTSWTVRALEVTADRRIVAGCGLGGVYQWPRP